ncbi:MAG: hypothetical protein A2Y08_01435 [Planctomycetes bacterium GWA2_40_7]|nr:MAG: hypothetical protein A2Y08_01435 [Planctomycetes bacterium GWA2_40_7]HCN19296.1 hypothetical protein [Planctomycetia bacterium]
MARTNKLKLAVSLIENVLSETDEKIGAEVRTEHYGAAGELQKYKEGVLHALNLVKMANGRTTTSLPEIRLQDKSMERYENKA